MPIPVGQPVVVSATYCHESLEKAASVDKAHPIFKTLVMPEGIASELVATLASTPLRIWIVDNSGSMSTCDGHRLVHGPDGRARMLTSSRWAELGDALLWHGTMAAQLQAPTQFRLLNPPGAGALQTVEVGRGSPDQEVAMLRAVVTAGPTGRTPLCAQIALITDQIRRMEPALRASGQRVTIVIASDGAATDGDVAAAMRPLESLPVWVVVRLCTDDDAVVSYWNSVDENLELDMDVLDDLCGEASEVSSHNPWLTYADNLHRLREWGTPRKLFDVLDEKPLSAPEMKELVELVLGQTAADLPDPQLDLDGFANGLTAILKKTKQVWDPNRKVEREWFLVSKLKAQYGSKAGCAVQ